jgi:hypothetical protein
LLTQIAWTKKPSLTWYAPEHVDSENINLKIGHGRGFYQLWPKIQFFGFFFKSLISEFNYSKTVWDVFHDLKNVKIAEKSLKIGLLLSILGNFSQF